VQTIASTFSVVLAAGRSAERRALGCCWGFATGVRPSTTPHYGLLGTQVLSDGNHPARVSGPVPNSGARPSEVDAT
jgi:hypothetical protein